MADQQSIQEVLPKQGMLFYDQTPMPVLCKPKIMPMKSVTLEKLEQMQKEAQETVRRQEQEQRMEERLLQQQEEIMRRAMNEGEDEATTFEER